MNNFLRFLVSYHLIILFILLESVGLVLLVNNNNYQNTRYTNFVKNTIGIYAEKRANMLQYFSLRDVNQKLSEENTRLKNIIEKNNIFRTSQLKEFTIKDTISKQEYSYLSAKIVNNTVNKQYNYITLDKGSLNGIEKEMSVITQNGVVGIIVSVSDRYSIAISLLNRNLKVSAKIKKNNYFGSFDWPGVNYKTGSLNEIPIHVNVKKGDTIISSGFSSYFPEGIILGYVSDYKIKGGNFYQIDVALAADFKNINHVYIVKSLRKSEKEQLEKEFLND